MKPINIEINSIIPGGPFLYYPKVENFGALNDTVELTGENHNAIFFHNSILINSDKLTSLKAIVPIRAGAKKRYGTIHCLLKKFILN